MTDFLDFKLCLAGVEASLECSMQLSLSLERAVHFLLLVKLRTGSVYQVEATDNPLQVNEPVASVFQISQ